MTWTNKSKTSSSTPRGRLLTPDSNQILVGSSESEIMIWQAYAENWTNRSKTDESGSWTNKTKISA